MVQTDLAFPILDNIVIGCPGNSQETADFYARLLQLQVIREDWLMIAKGPDAEPRLAFDDDLDPELMSVWGDPARHVDHPLPGVIGRVVVDCPDPRSLARFYADFLDMPEQIAESADMIMIGRTDGRLPAMAFRRSVAAPPRWPDPAYPQQMHVDVWVDDLETAVQRVLRSGAIELPAMGGSCPVFADPAGHPFCICT